MKNFKIIQRINKLKQLIVSTRAISGENLELQAHWAKYICVLCAGFLEFALAQIYSDFVQQCSPSFIHNHVSQYLAKIQNPKSTKFVEVAKSFKSEWGQELQIFIDEMGRKEAIGNIMINRHLIAHGKDSQITISQIDGYLKKSIEVLEFIEKQCGVKYELIEIK